MSDEIDEKVVENYARYRKYYTERLWKLVKEEMKTFVDNTCTLAMSSSLVSVLIDFLVMNGCTKEIAMRVFEKHFDETKEFLDKHEESI